VNKLLAAKCEPIKRQEKPRQWLESMIEVSFPSKELIRISFRQPGIPEAARIVDAVVLSYVSEVRDWSHDYLRSEIDRLNNTGDELNEQVRSIRKDLIAVRDRLGLSNDTAGLAEWQKQLQGEITKVGSEAVVVDKNLEIAKRQLEATGEDANRAMNVDVDEELQKQGDHFNQVCQQLLAEKLITEITTNNRFGDAELTEHRNRMEAVVKAVEVHRSGLREEVTEKVRKHKQASLVNGVAQLEQRLQATRAVEEKLRQQHKEISEALNQIKRESIDLKMIQEELRVKEELLAEVRKKADSQRVDLGTPVVHITHVASK
jgi:hypothetical protein